MISACISAIAYTMFYVGKNNDKLACTMRIESKLKKSNEMMPESQIFAHQYVTMQ